MRVRWLHRLRDYLVPGERAGRLYSIINLVNAVGDGLYLSGTAIFATRVVGLHPQQLGIAISAAGLAGVLAAGTMGSLADRFGAKRMMMALCLLEATGYLTFCVVRTFPMFIVNACFIAAVGFGKGPANAALASAAAAKNEVVKLRSQALSLYNLGFCFGAALSAVVISIGLEPVYYALPIGNAISFLSVAALVRQLPEYRTAPGTAPRRMFGAVRSLPFMLTVSLIGIMAIHQSLILIVGPLWLIDRTRVPGSMLGVLLTVNTVLCVAFQVRASKGAGTLPGSLRKARWAAAVLVAGCIVLGLTHAVSAVLAIPLAIAGYAMLTSAEMLQTASAWGITYALAPEHAQAEYLGALSMSMAGQSIAGPAVGTWLVINYGLTGWLTLAVAVTLAAAALGPMTRWTVRAMRCPPVARHSKPGEVTQAYRGDIQGSPADTEDVRMTISSVTKCIADELCDELISNEFGPFFGTPCGILAQLYSACEERAGLITVAREDNAVGIAAGAALAGHYPVVLMQNSGLGQSVNAIASLILPYRIPILLIVSVRGIPPDPTQENEAMGRVTQPLLRGLGISTVTLDPADDTAAQIGMIRALVREEGHPAALLIPPTAFGWHA